ncbi:MAG TPA: HD domain-containing protein [Tetragenococcus sp.]|nr:HD domain-containing protein [Tetragenococcus sp.]
MTKIEQIIAYAQDKLMNEKTGHDFYHARQTAVLAQKIIKQDQLSVNEFIVFTSAYLHDVIDDKVTKNAEKALRELGDFLVEVTYSEDEVQQILFIITHLSFSDEMFGEKKELPLEGKIVQDADRLEALGAGGILRAAYFSGAHGQKIYDPTIKVRKLQSKSEYRQPSTTINHFYEKLCLLPELMNTTYGKQEGLKRKKFMDDFLKQFYKEQEI